MFLRRIFISYSLLFCGRLISTCFEEKSRENFDTVLLKRLKGEEKEDYFDWNRILSIEEVEINVRII